MSEHHFVLEVDVEGGGGGEIPQCVNPVPHVYHLIVAVDLCVGFLEYHGADVIEDGFGVDVHEEIINEDLHAFAALEQVHFELLLFA